MSINFEDAVERVIRQRHRQKNVEQYFNDPAKWSMEILGIKMWSAQREASQDVVENRNVAIKAAHGTGKSWWVAILICWWIDTRYPRAFVASTAPSQAQISAIVWRYVRQLKEIASKRHKEYLRRVEKGLDLGEYEFCDHELPGYITSDNQWKEEGGNLLGFGRKPPENKEDDSFQGIHDAYVLAVGDEAVGLTKELIDGLGNITSNANSRRILICNPTNPSSYVGKIFKDKMKNWVLRTISAFDSPNFTDEKNEFPTSVLEKLVDPSYVEDKKAEYGENSARYKSRVEGEFAYDLGDTLIKPEDITVGYDTQIVPDPSDPVILGVDVARFGNDLSTIYSNKGGHLRFIDKVDSHAATQCAAWINKWALDLGASEVRIDSLGLGGPIIDIVMSFNPVYTVIGMNGLGTTPDKRQWHNARAYWWDEFRRQLRDGKIDLDMNDENMVDELQAVEYKFSNQSGGVLIESKEDMKKRGMKSPDFADAAVYACAGSEFIHGDFGPKKGKILQDPSDIIGELPDYLRLMIDWA